MGIGHGYPDDPLSEKTAMFLFSEKSMGNMKREEGFYNRQKLMLRYFPTGKLVTPEIAHGGVVGLINNHCELDDLVVAGTDGLVTKESVALGVYYADCPPVLFYDLTNYVFGVAHCSYKSLLEHIASNTLGTMLMKGAKHENIRAIIGPGICQACYEFGDNAPELFKLYIRQDPSVIYDGRPGHYQVDLKKMIRIQLTMNGLPVQNISYYQACTKCDENYFSARREKKKPVDTNIAIIKM